MFLFSDHGDAKGELSILYDIKKSDRSPEEKQRIQADMLSCLKRHSLTFKEYVRYDFEHKTTEEQESYISDKEHIAYCDRLNAPEVHTLMDNKYLTYLHLRPFFRREIILITPDEAGAFTSFVQKYPSLIIKPNEDWGGAAITATGLSQYGSPEEMLTDLRKKYPMGFLAEEKLSNAGILHDVHPASLNTLRVSTIRLPDGIHVIHPRVRIGCGGSIIDNISAGGYQGQIDVDTGVVITACDVNGQRREIHADTGIAIQGMQIPAWAQAVDMVKELAAAVEGLRYCGWDIAYTDRGWVLIEGNDWGQFGWQTVEQKGCRAEFDSYLAAWNL